MSKPKVLRLKRLFYRHNQHFNSNDAKNQLSDALSFVPIEQNEPLTGCSQG